MPALKGQVLAGFQLLIELVSDVPVNDTERRNASDRKARRRVVDLPLGMLSMRCARPACATGMEVPIGTLGGCTRGREIPQERVELVHRSLGEARLRRRSGMNGRSPPRQGFQPVLGALRRRGKGGAGGIRTLVQTTVPRAFYMLIRSLVFDRSPGKGTLTAA